MVIVIFCFLDGRLRLICRLVGFFLWIIIVVLLCGMICVCFLRVLRRFYFLLMVFFGRVLGCCLLGKVILCIFSFDQVIFLFLCFMKVLRIGRCIFFMFIFSLGCSDFELRWQQWFFRGFSYFCGVCQKLFSQINSVDRWQWWWQFSFQFFMDLSGFSFQLFLIVYFYFFWLVCFFLVGVVWVVISFCGGIFLFW